MRRGRGRAWTAALLLTVSAPAAAQSGGWQYEFTPYLWASAMKGDVGLGTLPRLGVDMSFADIAHVLDFGAMGAFEARRDRWGILFDAIYMKTSDAGTATRTGPGPAGAALTAAANGKFTQTMLAAAAAYRVSDGVTAVDVVGGARYSKVDVSVDFHASLFAAAQNVSRSGDKSWVDPYVGLRALHPLTERWSAYGYADAGGFGLGSESTWQAVAGMEYAFSKTVSAKFGYRAIAVDYDKDGFHWNMTNRGPYLGAGIRF